MLEIIKVEIKRVICLKNFLLFIFIIGLFSAYSSYTAVKNYNITNEKGIAVKWNENLAHGNKYAQGKYITEEYLQSMKNKGDSLLYLDESNVELLIFMNYDGKRLKDLSDEELKSFYSKRISEIENRLDDSSTITYTENEKHNFIEKAKKLTSLSMEYSEGWKVLNMDMGKFEPFLLVLIAIFLLPYLGSDPQTKMKELLRSTKLGKKELDYARVVAAFLSGISHYSLGVFLYFSIKMLPFGAAGGNQHIQSNAFTFFSLYNIIYWQQFILNVLIGFVALIFMICFTLLVTMFMDGIMTGAVAVIFFWILLIIFDQMGLYEVNHWFANFMPLKMTAFSHYYTQNEVYRVFGKSMSCMSWTLLFTTILSIVLLFLTLVGLKLRRKTVRL